jgi:hypothetical protein
LFGVQFTGLSTRLLIFLSARFCFTIQQAYKQVLLFDAVANDAQL